MNPSLQTTPRFRPLFHEFWVVAHKGSTVLCCTTLNYTEHCTALHCTALSCTTVHCTVQSYTAPYLYNAMLYHTMPCRAIPCHANCVFPLAYIAPSYGNTQVSAVGALVIWITEHNCQKNILQLTNSLHSRSRSSQNQNTMNVCIKLVKTD